MKNDSNVKVTFSHYPLYDSDTLYYKMINNTERTLLIDLYARNNVKYAFCGHTHEPFTCNYGSFEGVVVDAFSENSAFVMLDVNGTSMSYRSIKF